MDHGYSVIRAKRDFIRIAVLCGVGFSISAANSYFESRKASRESATPRIHQTESGIAAPTADPSSVAGRAKARVDVTRALATEQVVGAKTVAPEIAAIEKLKSIRRCEKEETKDCPIESLLAKTEADGYHALLVDQTVSELAYLKALAEDDLSRDGATRVPVAALAGAYIKHPDDNVREQALLLAELLPERDAATVVEIATRAVRTTVSGPLAVQALRLMAQTRSANPELVDKTLREVFKTGGWDVREAIAAEILPFITHENRNLFAKIQAQAPIRSKQALHLRLGLEEFDRMERL